MANTLEDITLAGKTISRFAVRGFFPSTLNEFILIMTDGSEYIISGDIKKIEKIK